MVCLEEYIDGESRVMRLPCGHEFHADCVVPWLTNRRRVCPICKLDIVRSLRANGGNSDDQTEDGEETASDVQDRAAETVNDSPTASIPIPARLDPGDEDDDEDIERGQHDEQGSEENSIAPRSGWRNIISGSLSALSGETLGQPSPRDRTR